MSRSIRLGGTSLLALATLLPASAAQALDGGVVRGHQLTVDVTETAVVSYNFDNRNTRLAEPKTRVDDHWGEWRNRLTVQASWWRLVLGMRIDSSQFFHTPNPNTLAREDVANRLVNPNDPDPPSDAQYIAGRTQEYGAELSNRYLNSIYPSKLYLSYMAPGLEATAGDVYAQFGRGLVLSVRKVDELAVDTTIRGAKVIYKPPMPKGTKASITAVAGFMNPLRIDEMSGRVLQAPQQWYFWGMPEPVNTHYVPNAIAGFVPDRALGLSAEGGVDAATVGVHGVMIDRPLPCFLRDAPSACTPFSGNTGIQSAEHVRNASVSLNLPDLAKHGSFYFEAAVQQQRHENPSADRYDPNVYTPRTSADDVNGHALYAAGTANAGPFSLTVEGKHYRKFFPLRANIQTAGQGSVGEFSLLQYSAPPTTLPIYVDSETNNFNACVTGGRGRLDARVTSDLMVYGWVGRYATWGEHADTECEIKDSRRNNVWDAAVGVEGLYDKKSSHVYAWLGARDDQLAVVEDVEANPTSTYYRETYVRYDLVKMLVKTWSLQMTGVARRRYYPSVTPDAYWEGEHYTALQWSPKLTVAFGYEYKTIDGAMTNYYNGSVKWRFNSDTSVRAFVGQQRGALRCIAGVCRQFPPFEGAKVEAVVRF